jgi:hypothetical protein
MSTQTTETSVTFVHSFTLSSVEGVQPAGTYRLVAHEHQQAGPPFHAVERLTTLLCICRPVPNRAAPARSCASIRASLPMRWRRTPPSPPASLVFRCLSPEVCPPATGCVAPPPPTRSMSAA